MVELKKKITLRTKTTGTPEEAQKPQVALRKKQPVSESIPPSPSTTGGEAEHKGKWKWYAAAIAGLLVLGGGGYYLSQLGDEGDAPVAVVVEPSKSADEIVGVSSAEGKNEQSQTEAKVKNADDDSNKPTEGGNPTQSRQNHSDATLTNKNDDQARASDSSVRNNSSTGGTVSRTNATSSANVTGTVEEEAREVIRGKYGNGDVRKRNLGDRYAEIQSKVNEMYRNGQFN